MNTAVIAPGTAPSRPIRPSTLAQRFLRRAGLVLAWSRTGGPRYSRDELAVLHERRLEAERLREDNFRGVTLARHF